MNRLFVTLIAALIMTGGSHAQQISFTARDVTTGSTVGLHSVYIKNLITGRDTTISGGQSINLLPLTDVDESGASIQPSFTVYRNYPNPFTHSTTVMASSPVQETATVKMYDVLGKLRYDSQVHLSEGDNQFTLHAGSLPSGIYILTVTTSRGTKAVKMMKLGGSGAGVPVMEPRGSFASDANRLSKSTAVAPIYMFVGSATDYVADTLENIVPEDGKNYQFDLAPSLTDNLYLVYPAQGDSLISRTPTLKWTSVRSAILYEVAISTDANFTHIVATSKPSVPYYPVGSSLDPGLYYWKARSEDNQYNWSGWSDTHSFTVLDVPVLTSPVDQDSAVYTFNPSFQWNWVSYAQSYRLMVDDDYDFSSPAIDQTQSSTSYYVQQGLGMGKYYWRVCARDNQSLWRQWSEIHSFTIPDSKVSLTYPIDADSIKKTQPKFEWNSVWYANQYQILVDDQSDFSSPLVEQTTWDRNYTPESHLPLGQLYWKVRARDSKQVWHDWSDARSFILPEVSICMTVPINADSTNGTFKWTPVYYAASYQILIDDDANFTYPLKLESFSSIPQITFPADSFQANTSYYVKVRAQDRQLNWIPWSSTVQFKYSPNATGYEYFTDPRDGVKYRIETIGNQVWMAENLKATQYRNGDEIPNITDNGAWAALSTGGRCAYSNDENTAATYGYLYNWYAATDARNIAPEGWHVPSKEEFQELLNAVGTNDTERYDALIDGGSSGFNALLGGDRSRYGSFYGIGYSAYFWSTTPNNSYHAWAMYLDGNYRSVDLSFFSYLYANGFSVRCVRD